MYPSGILHIQAEASRNIVAYFPPGPSKRAHYRTIFWSFYLVIYLFPHVAKYSGDVSNM